MISSYHHIFKLDTLHSSYVFRVLPSGHLEHLYYGDFFQADSEEELLALSEKHAFPVGNSINYEDFPYSLEDICLEFSTFGKGDLREPTIKIDLESTDFIFDEAKIQKRIPYNTLPTSHGECDSLFIRLLDRLHQYTIELTYNVYEEVITRNTRFINNEKESLHLDRLMSLQLDFNEDDYIFTTFNGSWANEMHRHDHPLLSSKIVNSSITGTTSSRAQSFVMLSKKDTTEDHGIAYGFHLLYSGNHQEIAEVSPYHKTRLVTGINEDTFHYEVKPGECFEAPEAIMCFSSQGFNQLSYQLHDFIRQHIINKKFAFQLRPLLLNSWEAHYFDINEKNLLQLAKKAKEVGIELFVIDDGWFKGRNDDTSSLGDWEVDHKKFPHGLAHFSQKIKQMGMSLGIWVEPEMVNVESDLYRAHPSWCIDDVHHNEGRHQRLLDLTNQEVIDYLVNQLSHLFHSCEISYVKWDMNRIFSDYHAPHTPRGEIAHRSILGLYQLIKRLTQLFPDILFEGCSAGGNRFDLGILSYFPQIWPSDNTDSHYRQEALRNYSYGYPINSFTSHVSANINHQTLRHIPLATRFNISCIGILGYEINLNDLSKEELKEIKEDISFYKQYREVLQFGHLYRHDTGITIVYKDKAIGIIYQGLSSMDHYKKFIARGLQPESLYHFYNRPYRYNIKEFGDLVNTASPIHIKPNSLTQHVISKFVTMPGEKEDYIVHGSLLMNAGISLKQSYHATGFNEETRHFPDFSSRLYIIEKCHS